MSKLYVNEVHSKTGSTKALEIDSNGIITQSSPVGFNASLSGSLSISSNNTRFTNWTTSSANFYGGFNTDGAGGTMLNLSTGIAQVPVTGYYSIIFNTRIDSFAGTYHYIDVMKTDSSGTYPSPSSFQESTIARSLESATATDYTELQVQSVAYLQANDYIAAFWSNSGDNSVSAVDETTFSMFKIG